MRQQWNRCIRVRRNKGLSLWKVFTHPRGLEKIDRIAVFLLVLNSKGHAILFFSGDV